MIPPYAYTPLIFNDIGAFFGWGCRSDGPVATVASEVKSTKTTGLTVPVTATNYFGAGLWQTGCWVHLRIWILMDSGKP